MTAEIAAGNEMYLDLLKKVLQTDRLTFNIIEDNLL